MKSISLILLISLTFASCQDFGKMRYVTQLPGELKETSGIEIFSNDGSVWVIEDSGNKDHLYKVDSTGVLIKEIKVKNAKNKDWEDLAKDDKGNLYIGDFGNNHNNRKDLTIYKVPNPDSTKTKSLTAEKITFYFPEQISFPPNPRELLYDVESFIYYEHYLYLFTRNRMPKKLFDGRSLVYKIPAMPGNHRAVLVDQFVSCEESINCQISSAAISPDKTKIALLSYDKIWILSEFEGDDFFKGKVTMIDLGHASQKEGVCFKDDQTLYIADEIGKKKSGRNIYEFSLKAEP